MGVILFDEADSDRCLAINYWNWRAIVEAIRRLDVLPSHVVDGLHQQYAGTGLSLADAKAVAVAMRAKLLSELSHCEQVMLDGTTTTVPDDGTFYRSETDSAENYSTNREVLEAFATFCESVCGFKVC